jgi:uncharacterized protein
LRIWIDLSNSPHPLLFAPVARELGREHEVLITARDHAQTIELARQSWELLEVIGGDSPGGRARKAAALASRVRELVAWARVARPDAALSHNSYAQLIAARRLGIPAVTAMDFEHQPANHLGFRLANKVLLPEALRGSRVSRQGASARKARFYPGLKEEVYLGDFSPDRDVLARLGIERTPGSIVVVSRTPPSRALYHGFDNPLFTASLQAIAADERARLVVLVRHPEQRAALEALRLPRCTIPATLDARSLIYAADLVLGAGGTMTREAALLGVPTFSLYAGTTPAVDTLLVRAGRLRRLTSVKQLFPLQPRPREPVELDRLRDRSRELAAHFVSAATLRPPPAGLAASTAPEREAVVG